MKEHVSSQLDLASVTFQSKLISRTKLSKIIVLVKSYNVISILVISYHSRRTSKISCYDYFRIVGICEGIYERFYYDHTYKQCLAFEYGGCLGNANKFETKQECENDCVRSDNIAVCEQPVEIGPCMGNYTRNGQDYLKIMWTILFFIFIIQNTEKIAMIASS